MTEIVRIEDCTGCPNCEVRRLSRKEDINKEIWLCSVQGKIIQEFTDSYDNLPGDIPKWCPLEDADL